MLDPKVSAYCSLPAVLTPIECRWVLALDLSRLKTPVYFIHPLHTDPLSNPSKQRRRRPSLFIWRCNMLDFTAGQLPHPAVVCSSGRPEISKQGAGISLECSRAIWYNVAPETSCRLPCRQTATKVFPRLIVGFPSKTSPPFAR